MNQPPKKRRWQFSLKVLFVAMTMAGVGMGLMRYGIELNDQGLESREKIDAFIYLGGILLTASPGVLIGYGFDRLRGAIIGGFASFATITFFVITFLLPQIQ